MNRLVPFGRIARQEFDESVHDPSSMYTMFPDNAYLPFVTICLFGCLKSYIGRTLCSVMLLLASERDAYYEPPLDCALIPDSV